MEKNCCIVFGGYVNSYSVIQELYENGVKNIILIDYSKDAAYYSNMLSERYIIEKSPESLLKTLLHIKKYYSLLILFPTQDIHLDHLVEIYPKIKEFCFVGFNPENAVTYQNKFIQYDFCEKTGIPYPKTIKISNEHELSGIENLKYPIIVKPVVRDNLSEKVFRNLILTDKNNYDNARESIIRLINEGNQFVASEIIPGSGDNIYAYIAYRHPEGKILSEWTGKKLAQFPDDFGVFSSSKTIDNEVVREQGRVLIEAMNLWGFAEPEFKYDHRDNKYKLMEVNLRPMMWHRSGTLDGSSLNYLQYLHAIDELPENGFTCKYSDTHFVHIYYEIINLFRRTNYFKVFKTNVFGGKRTVIALLNKRDPKPFFISLFMIFSKYKHKRKRDNI